MKLDRALDIIARVKESFIFGIGMFAQVVD
jgi:hypothetical protein